MQMNFETIRIQPSPLTVTERAAHERALSTSQNYLRAEAELLGAIDEVDRLRLFEKLGHTSTYAYCRAELKLSEAVAAYFINVARTSREVPQLREAIEKGKLSVPKAVKICSVVTKENQAEWIEKAEKLPKAKLEEEVAAKAPRKPRPPKVKPVGKNRKRIEFEEDDEFVKLLKRAQDLECRRTGKSVSMQETLRAALELYVDKRDPVKKAERAKTAEIPKQTKRGRMPLPAALRHALNLQDQGRCRIQGPDGKECGSSRFIDSHHIIAVRDGGLNELSNLITVCGSHHRQLHMH